MKINKYKNLRKKNNQIIKNLFYYIKQQILKKRIKKKEIPLNKFLYFPKSQKIIKKLIFNKNI